MAIDANILVTGGTGFIGRHLVSQLVARGQRPRLLCRSPEAGRRLFGPDVEIVSGDLRDAPSLEAACAGIERVFHIGGLYEFGAGARHDLWETNVCGTDNLLNACWKARVTRVIHCSTAGILSPARTPMTHRDFPSAPPAGCHYKRSKWHSERLALQFAARGLPVVIASPTAPIGSGDERPTPTGRMITDLMHGRFPCYSRTGLNVVAVEDVAAGLITVDRHGEAGARYLLGNWNVWLGDFLHLVAQTANVPAPRWVMPWPLISAGGLIGEVCGWISKRSGRRLCWETAHFAKQRQFFDLSHSRESLGWQARKPIEQSVSEAVAWFRGRAVCQSGVSLVEAGTCRQDAGSTLLRG